jgi:tetratricopeptide (TPR) repeat protein
MAMPTPVETKEEKKGDTQTEEVTETDTEKTSEQDAPLAQEEVSWGLSDEELRAAVTAEALMQQQDKDIRRLLECRNEMEAYIFEMRSTCNQKHGALIADHDGLRSTCDEFENWLWDFGETVSLQEVLDKFAALKDKIEGPEAEVEVPGAEGTPPSKEMRRQGGLCSEYLAVVAQEKAAVEKALADEAAQAALEQGGEDKDDHDFRKLRKPERMRLVMKNKEEGTELFKGGNIRPAAARYQKALTHAAKFFDLSPEDTEEVSAVKLSLHLNLTQCYLKLENWDSAIRHADEALALDTKAVKALFRRAQAWEARKEYDKALADMKQAAELNAPKEDKLITKGMERVKKLIQKEKEKEKKMWGKAFS